MLSVVIGAIVAASLLGTPDGRGFPADAVLIELEEIEKAGATLRAQVEQVAEQHLDGWIIDLRLNGGGNPYPMLLGLEPVLGDGVVGGTTDASGEVVQRWVLKPDGLF